MAKGIDLLDDAGLYLPEIRDAALDFVCRYYRDCTSPWPSLSATEARLLSGTGLKLVAVWEAASHDASCFSRVSGANDGASAYHRATATGQPFGTAIYFVVNYDATPADVSGPISQYFRGVAAGLAAAGGSGANYRIGVYGSGLVCKSLIAAGLARYGWLAMPNWWRGYGGFLDACDIRQDKALNLPFDHASDRAAGDYGEFGV